MATIFSTEEAVLELIKERFIHVKGNEWEFKKEYGKGFAMFFGLGKGQFLTYGESYQFKPMIVKTEMPKSEVYGSSFSIIYKEVEGMTDEDKQKEQKYEIASDGIVLLSGELDRHRIWLPQKKYKFLTFNFTESWFREIADSIGGTDKLWEYLGDKDKLDIYIPLTGNIKQIVNQLFFRKEELLEYAIEPFIQLKAFELIMLSLSQYFKNLNGKNAKKLAHPEDFKKIIELRDRLRNDPVNAEGLDDMADSIGMSRSKMQRNFKKVVGSSIYSYVLKCKMEKAFELLTAHESVSSVAYDLGYSTTGNFSVAFKDYFSFLPSEIK